MSKKFFQQKNCSVVILAAGNSDRMGFPKALLAINDTIFLKAIINVYLSFHCRSIVVVTNKKVFNIIKKEYPDLLSEAIFIVNKLINSQRFHSLQLGLKACNNTTHTYIQNIDNPFVNTSLLDDLFKHRNNADFITPRYKGKGGHPILISPGISDRIINNRGTSPKLSSFLKPFTKAYFHTEDSRILININTPEAYQKYIHTNNETN